MAEKRLVVAISSRALFDLDESHRIYEEQGTQAYCEYQIKNLNVVAYCTAYCPCMHT